MMSSHASSDSSLFGLPELDSSGEQTPSEIFATDSCSCLEPSTPAKGLPCYGKCREHPDTIQCPKCNQSCSLPPLEVAGFASNSSPLAVSVPLPCTGCKTKESYAVARCFDCANYLCGNCLMAHQYMHCFQEHHVVSLKDGSDKDFKADKLLLCPRHPAETLMYFCRTCDTLVCKECADVDHPKGLHDHDRGLEVGPRQVEILAELLEQGRTKNLDLRNASKSIEHLSTRLQVQYHKAQAEINDTYSFYCSVLEERKEELNKELDDLYNSKRISLSLSSNQIQEMVDRVQKMALFFDRIVTYSSNSEILMFKQLLDNKLQTILSSIPDIGLQGIDLEFLSNYQAIQVGVRNTFGYIRHCSESSRTSPQSVAWLNGAISSDKKDQIELTSDSSIVPRRFSLPNNPRPFPSSLGNAIPYDNYDKWSPDPFAELSSDDLTSKLICASLKCQLKRQKMIYHCKFGEFGVLEGQFTEPSGVAVNAQNDIVVADTNNHRIQIFDKEGRFKFQFGECGKRDGQLLYPNRVAVVRASGDIVVTERSPTHQVQIYNQYGQFVRKFGATVLQHPRGVTVDTKGRVLVVECKVMRVLIFDQLGNVLHKFGCSKHLEFPNGIVVNDRQEIFISDNRAHCVKVFNYDGVFLRQIGGEGLTNYPIGVCINQNNEILVADNHNNFNITIFTQDGLLVSASESKVKHAQCFDVALMDGSSVVLASKDYRLYIYRYMQLSSLGTNM